MLNGIKIATVKDNDNPYYYLSDHLGSNSIILDSVGNIMELSDYKPYGSINYETGVSLNEYKFTDKLLDNETVLQYFGERYLDNNSGRFISMEPVMMLLHDGNQLKKLSDKELQEILSDPQSLNNYSYSKNNPIIFVDPDGNWWKAFFTGQQSWSSFQTELGQAAQQLYNDSSIARIIMDHPYASGAAIGVGSGLTAYGASTAITSGLTQLGIIGTQADKADDVIDYTKSYGQQIGSKMNEVLSIFKKAEIKAADHAIFRTATRGARGITPEKVIDTFKNGTRYFDKTYNNINYFKDGIRVSIGKSGEIITVVTQKTMENSDRFIKY